MNEVIWKAFQLGSIFERSTVLAFKKNQKDLTLTEEKQNDSDIALISASRNGSGRVGYLSEKEVPQSLISVNKITFDDQWGYTFFQKERFVITGGHNAILELKNSKLETLMQTFPSSFSFVCLIMNKITLRSEIFGYGYKINNKFDREIILLPCLEVTKNDDYIWEENGHYYTLAVEYIEHLMNEAKELREQKTIRLYEAERAKYERERAKYEEGYKKERDVLVWKGFKLGDLYSFDSSNQYPFTQKQIDISDNKDDIHTIAVIAQSALNNGVIGYIENSDNIKKYISHGNMTFSLNFGICFYHSYDYVLLDTHGSIFRLMPNNQRYNELLEGNLQCNLFIAKLINKVCAKSLYNWQWKPNSPRASREIILLPCLEVTKNDDYIWEENGHYYTLAVEYISYMYLSGRVEFNQRLIDKYEYKY